MPSDKVRADHSPDAIRRRISSDPDHSYLRDFVYGAIDGAVTTFAVVASVAAAGLSNGIVIVMGLANLLADGFSMAAGNYLGTRAEVETREKRRRDEEDQIQSHPEWERDEIRQIFALKGFEGKMLDDIVEVITSDDKRWVDTMITEEFGLSLHTPSPWKAAGVTYLAFILIGMIPLLSYVMGYIHPGLLVEEPFYAATILTGVAFFSVGALKSRFVGKNWLTEGLGTLGVGTLAAGIAYAIGLLLRPLLDGVA
ncbi:VIT1/CCC1 transporter family protein [Verrucomicrobiaceae bacterium R5-34]|uniref:VIT1/CCC1 transporter family protein n=1 Tax=Oceaniferula flava TaxID=2800421 RepID=A0AAE2SB25_9BACT|nr:VIT1/CCC1 transporter family protein [Oceaniferula flavus]MBK1830000.1 VIT1/CCC1 transporter family protein [Verrucomicrobiaceae bacterium R5-34]MBK1855153.1 VIT1/CCC1 transporter family protein [Oceaniferula flavus]MBM1136459.1 VIT1/CCC1 transporter family protein [Oceaniferula flavus]